MKLCGTLAFALLLWSTTAWPVEPNARISLPELKTLAGQASHVVDITLDASLLAMASRFLDPKDPQDASAKEIISGLTGIYVKSYTFDGPFTYPKSELDGVRSQLAAPGWSRLVDVHSQRDGTDVEFYVLTEHDKASGLTLIASEPRQLTIVNIVGSIDLDKLHRLEGQFGVPKLNLQSGTERAR